MKHYFSGMMIALVLVLALVVGAVAMAENTEPEAPELPPVEEVQPEQPEAQQPAGDASTNDTATNDTALQEAFDAYRAAKQSGRQEELEAELKGYVKSGKLTQEQADLILNYYKEQESLRNGTCPNCGYQFQNGFGKGGRGMGGGRGMMGGKGGRGMGGCGMRGQQPTFGQQPTDGQANGTAFVPDSQALTGMAGSEGI